MKICLVGPLGALVRRPAMMDMALALAMAVTVAVTMWMGIEWRWHHGLVIAKAAVRDIV